MSNVSINPVGRLSETYSDAPVIRALLQLVPGWSAADTLLQHRAQEIHHEKLRVFFGELANGEVLLTSELIESNDFINAFFSTLRAVTQTRHHEKVRLFAKLLSRFNFTHSNPPDEFDELISILDSLSNREFRVLCLLRSYETNNPASPEQNELQRAEIYWEQFTHAACERFSIRTEEFNSFITRLQRTGLFCELVGMYFGYEGYIGYTTPLFSNLINYIGSK